MIHNITPMIHSVLKNRCSLIASFLLLMSLAAIAQPTFNIAPDYYEADGGDIFCMEVNTLDFTDIISFDLTVEFNDDAIQFNNISNANTDLGATPTVVNNGDGTLNISWAAGDCGDGQNVTLDDCFGNCPPTLFELCFTAIEGYSEIAILDGPGELLVTRQSSCPVNIGGFTNTAFVAIDNKPVQFKLPDVDVNEGELVCVDVTVEDFFEIVSMQYSIGWYSQVLQFESIECVNLPGCSTSTFNFFAPDRVAISWVEPSFTGLTLDDGDAIVQICFTGVGNCGQASPVFITDEPTIIEVTNASDPGADIGILKQDGSIITNCFNPDGIGLIMADQEVCPGESICIPVTTENFVNIVDMEFSLKWNNDILQFTGLQNLNAGLNNFDLNDFDQSSISAGLLSVDYKASCNGEDLNFGATLFEMCFDVMGGANSTTALSVVNDPIDILFTDNCLTNPDNLGANTDNASISICQLSGPSFSVGTASGNPGQSGVCVDVQVQEFNDVTSLSWGLEWESNILEYTGVQNFDLEGLNGFDFEESNANVGSICVEWDNPTPVSVSDGVAIFEICFDIIGDPNEVSPISFPEIDGFPCNIEVTTQESNGIDVGLNSSNGEISVLNPFNFVTNISSGAAVTGAEACVDFTVENFDEIEGMEYTVSWNPDDLEYNSLNIAGNLPEFTAANYSDNNQEFGTLTFDWGSSNGGIDLADGTTIFTICFDVTGDVGDCSPITISENPLPIEIIASGFNVGMEVNAGEICIADKITIENADITTVSCPGDATGAVDITVVGGSGMYDFIWTGPSVTGGNANNEDLMNIEGGNYTVIAMDQTNSSLSDTLTVFVGSSGFTIADAGEDYTLNCGNGLGELDGTGSSQGAEFTYEWATCSGGTFMPGTETTLMPTHFGAGIFKLTVSNSASGCIVTDTVQVFSPSIQAANASTDEIYSCKNDTILLSGLGSPEEPQIVYEWTTDGGSFVAGTDTQIDAMATAPGFYYLTVMDTENQCMNTDTVFVQADTLSPIAAAGAGGMITCVDNSVVLDGSASSTGTDYEYEWRDPQNDLVSMDIMATASVAGMYSLMVTDTTNGCSSTDFVLIDSEMGLPIADAGAEQVLTCTTLQVMLDGTGSEQGNAGEYEYEWTTIGGNIIPPSDGLTVMVDQPGTYSLKVTNVATGCEGFSDVLVTLDDTPPLAEAGDGFEITCNILSDTLDATAGTSAGNFSYQWTAMNGSTIEFDNTLNPVVSAADTYTLTVTSGVNGCTASDNVDVTLNDTPPMAAIEALTTDQVINCETDMVTLDATASAQGTDIIYEWSGPNCLDDTNILEPTVTCSGMFTIMVTDTLTGCSNDAVIMVLEDLVDPTADAGPDVSADCNTATYELNGSDSSLGAGFEYAWTVNSGSGMIVSDTSELIVQVDGPGTYVLTVTNTENGCTSFDPVFVANNTELPMVDLGDDITVDCDNPTASIDISTSVDNGPDFTAMWTAVGGAGVDETDPLMPIFSGADVYTLTVTNTMTGCESSDDIEVISNGDLPTADGGGNQDLDCADDTIVLDATGSSTGADIVYSWIVIDGTGTITAGTETTLMPEIDGAGTFELTVTNNGNGCSATAEVVITDAITFANADATIDSDPCENEALLMANLPNGTTGQWTTASGATIDNPMDMETMATGIPAGVNQFTWTLSGPNCPDYSTTTIMTTIEAATIANDDLLDMEPGVDTISFDVLSNDALNGVVDYTFNVLTQPAAGTLADNGDGMFSYEAIAAFSGMVEFTYEICNPTCASLCDTASVMITVQNEFDANNIPNGITPNEDGINDALIFDNLRNNPEDYPDNDIVIFNRWGDVVYKMDGYDNNWKGTNMNGQPLPDGTYYYILRLNISEGEIFRGDVTIIR